MEAKQLLEELKKTVDALQIFSDIGKTLTSTLDIKEVLRIVLQKISDLIEPTSWALLLLDQSAMKLRYEILINDPGIDRTVPIRLGHGVVGSVAQMGKPVLWPDPSKKKLYQLPSDIEPPRDVKSLLCVPLRSKGNTLGVIEIRRKGDDVEAYGEEELATLSAIADYAAIAIENARNFQRVEELTITDDLTSLFNIRHMHKVLDAEMLRAVRYKKKFSMVFLDLDHFKQVNDTHGHIHGSQLLKETAEVIKAHVRQVDFAARYGGDEFVILLPETEKEEAVSIAERLREAIEHNAFLQDKGLKVHFTASFGVATFPEDAESKEDLIRMADEKMYSIKNTTRNRVAG